MKKPRHCLIIDDDPDDQEIFMMCLKKVNHEIHCLTASDCVEAISMLTTRREYTPDYIFLDVNMPKMNGIECLKYLKEIERLKKTRIFMYSTTSEDTVVNRSRELGAEEFIIKPSQTSVLKEKLSKIFNIVSKINPPEN